MLPEYRFIFTPNPTEGIFRVLIVKFELIVRIIAIDMMKNKVQRVPSYTFICIYRGIEHIVLTDPSMRDKSV